MLYCPMCISVYFLYAYMHSLILYVLGYILLTFWFCLVTIPSRYVSFLIAHGHGYVLLIHHPVYSVLRGI